MNDNIIPLNYLRNKLYTQSSLPGAKLPFLHKIPLLWSLLTFGIFTGIQSTSNYNRWILDILNLRKYSKFLFMVTVLAFIGLQSALWIHAMTHEDSNSDPCTICQNAKNMTSPPSVPFVVSEIADCPAMPWLPFVQHLPSPELGFFMPARGPPHRII